MKSTSIALLALLGLLVPVALAAQVQNENLANAVLAARRKNAALLQTYNWNCRTEILENDKMQDIRIDLVSVGPEGQLQRSMINDQPGKLPRGFLRRAIAQGQQQQAEKTVKELGALVDQYTLPSGGKVIAFLVQAQVQPVTTSEGTTVLQVTGHDVVVPGDMFTLTLNGKTLLPESVQVSTTYDGDAVTVTGSFITLPSGLNILQYATAVIPSKNITVMMHNYDCVGNN